MSDYQREKTDYLKVKKEAFAELKARHRDEREELYKNQRADRSALFAVSWKGRGAELNQRRSVMAARLQSEKLDLAGRQKEESERLKKHYPRQFPSFKAWLSMDADPELSVISVTMGSRSYSPPLEMNRLRQGKH